MSVVDVFHYTATVVLVGIGVVIAFVGWRIYITLVALHEVLDTTKQTLLDIKETPKKIQTNFMSSALNIARFIWGRG